MDETTITVRRACACAFPGILDALARRALQQTGANRPRCASLTVLRVENDMVPFAVQSRRKGTLQSWGVYEKVPCPGDPLGKRVLGVTTSLCPGCRAKAAAHPEQGSLPPAPGAPGCSHTPCAGCDGCCCEELEVHFTFFPTFPLQPHEVRWFFFTWFGMHAEARAALPPDYRNMDDVYLKYDAPPVEDPAEDPGAANDCPCPDTCPGACPQPAQCHAAGAPLLICNEFLLGEMRADPGLTSYNHLRPRWLELYTEQMGCEPANKEKSFREAVRKCRARLRHAA